jgi:outer membrane receptor protein involved in Fe transport
LKEGIKISNSMSFSAFVSVNNLFDAKYASSAFINPDIVNGEAYFLEPGLPRNFVLSFSLGIK